MESAIRAYDRKHSQVQDTGSVEHLLTDLKKLDRQEEETARAQIEARIEGRSTGVYDRLLSEISIQRQALRTRLQAAETQATHKLEPRTAAEKVRATPAALTALIARRRLVRRRSRLSGRLAFDLKQTAGLLVSVGAFAVFAGRHAGKPDDMAPLKRLACASELLDDGSIVLFGMQSAVFADRVAQQQVEDRADRVSLRAVALNEGGGMRLIVLPNRAVQIAQERSGILRFDRSGLFCQRVGRQLFPVAAHRYGQVIARHDQLCHCVVVIADMGDVAPGHRRQ